MIYYVDAKYRINQNDFIVDENDVYILHRVERKKGTNKEQVIEKIKLVDKNGNDISEENKVIFRRDPQTGF